MRGQRHEEEMRGRTTLGMNETREKDQRERKRERERVSVSQNQGGVPRLIRADFSVGL